MSSYFPRPSSGAQDLPTQEAIEASTEWLFLHVRMVEIKPPVWRQVIIPSSLNLEHIHPLILAAFDCKPRSSHTWSVHRVRRCTPRSSPIVTERNSDGYAVPNYTVDDDPIHEIFKDGFDLEDRHEMEDTSDLPDFERGLIEAMGGSLGGNKAIYSVEDSITIGRLVQHHRMAQDKHALMYDRGDSWDYYVMVERIIPAARVRSWAIGHNWILSGAGTFEKNGQAHGGRWFVDMTNATRRGQRSTPVPQDKLQKANERFMNLLLNPPHVDEFDESGDEDEIEGSDDD